MQPLQACPAHVLARVRGVLTDIDDTLTTDGRLPGQSYLAMERIQAAGLTLVAITGRPAGWCDHIARMWPVDAVVGENGAFWFRYRHRERRMDRHFVAEPDERHAQADRLRAIAAEVVRSVPGAAVAADQPYRVADLAIDFCEDVPRLADADVDRIAALMRQHGLNVKVSSIHVNGWFGDYDKLTTTCDLFARAFDTRADDLQARYAFIGDSPNDEPMFEFFGMSVGVANVGDFSGRMAHLPHYVTRARGGAGFAELADCLVRARGA